MKRQDSIAVRLAVILLVLMFMVPVGVMNAGTQENTAPQPAGSGIMDNEVNTVVIQPNATDGKDTYMYSAEPKYNIGARDIIYVGTDSSGEARTLIEFPTDTSNGEIERATLSIYCSYLGGDTQGVNVSAHILTAPWTEGSGDVGSVSLEDANWLNRTTATPWGAPGGDYITSIVSYTVVSKANSWYSFDITKAVKGWKNGSIPNYGLIITGTPVTTSSTSYVAFLSSDYSGAPAYHPKLTISYGAEITSTVLPITTNEDTPVDIDLSGRGHGTVEHISGSEDATNTWPLYMNKQTGRFQALYYPDEVGAEGKITRIALNRTAMESTNASNLRIYMAHTNLTDLTATFDDNYNGYLVEVFHEKEYVLNSSDSDSWLYFDLNGNFTYDSAHNLLVEIRWNGTGGSYIGTWNTYTAHTKRAYAWDDNADTALGTSAMLPVTKFFVDAVDTDVIDDRSRSNVMPFCPHFTSSNEMRMQTIYNSSAIKERGRISEIGFMLSDSSPNWANMSQFSIRMAYSDNSSLGESFEANHIGAWTEVFSREYFNASTDGNHGWLGIKLDTPFEYNGAHNLVVDIRWSGGSKSSADSGLGVGTKDATYNSRLVAYDYSAETGSADIVFYCAEFIFEEYRGFTWSATSSNTSLFTASISDNMLHIAPVADAYGSGTVELTLNNGAYSTTQSIPVTINPVNDAPVISAISPVTCVEDINYTLDMSLYASDVDNTMAELTFTTDSSYATVDGHNIVFNYPNGITGENVNITVMDPGHLSATIEVAITVTPVDDAPVISGLPVTITCVEDTNYTLDMSLYASDVDNTLAELTFTTDCDYATVDGHNITLNYPNGITEEIVTVTVEDPAHLNASAGIDVSVTSVNDAPVITGLPATISCTENTDYTLDMSLYTSDVDNSMTELTFTTDSDYATVDGHSIVFNYPYGAVGGNVTITVEDPSHLNATGIIEVSVNLGHHPTVVNLSSSANHIAVTFDMDMDMASVESAFSMARNGSAVVGTFVWTDVRTVIFTPSSVVNGTYDITVGTGAKAVTGAAMLSAYSGNYTAPAGLDSDGDGMPDSWETANGFNPLDSSDAATDADHDGLSNYLEYMDSTQPKNNDTDGDGIVDGFDAAPLTPNENAGTGTGTQPAASVFDPMMILVIILLVIVVILAVMLAKKKPGAPAAQEPQPAPPMEQAPPAPMEQPVEPAPEEPAAPEPPVSYEAPPEPQTPAEGEAPAENSAQAEDSKTPGEVLDLNEF